MTAIRYKRAGFSVIEAAAVTAILGILISIASVSYFKTSPKYRLLNAVREVHSRLNFARYRAVFQGRKVKVEFDESGVTVATYDPELASWIPGVKHFVEGVTIEANNTPVFHPAGTVAPLASIYLSNIWGKFRISLAISGRIRVMRIAPE